MKHKLICLLLCVLLVVGVFPVPAIASPDWPSDVSIEADAGIVMDARSGTILYGKNIHSKFSPASITKVLTSIIVLEHCSMDEMVTFSKNAVYNVEANSSSAGYDVGDQATVKDCLYALLLKSANEAANALAEHVAGNNDTFAEMMNEKAKELGCLDSHFTNPSGLNDDEHYVSAYDMALITKRAFEDETFSKIVSTPYYKLAPNKQNPNGQGISPGNKMIKKNWPDQYRPDVIGGKTGFTSVALNTLVICAKQEDTKLVTVILHSRGTQYDDTKRLLDFGFRNFQSVKISDYDATYSTMGDDLKISGLPTSKKAILTVDPNSTVILPKTADFSETKAVLDYTLPDSAPDAAVARVQYTLNKHPIGQAYLILSDPSGKKDTALPEALLDVKPASIPLQLSESDPSASISEHENRSLEGTKPVEKERFHLTFKASIPSLILKGFVAVFILAIVLILSVLSIKKRKKREEEERLMRRQRRYQRLRETGISESDFDLMMQKIRSGVSYYDSSSDLKKKHPFDN